MSKKAAQEAKPLLGRPGNNLKMGIVGLPNVGKSTLFNVLSKLQVSAENYPFCTIDPNVARVSIPDERFDFLVNTFNPASRVPAALTITDIAGLVRGAHAGQGLGNAFLSHIKAVDGIYHVLRVFNDEDIVHVEGAVDPVRDLDIIHQELRLKDVEAIETHISQLSKHVGRDKKLKDEYDFLTGTLLPWVKDDNRDVRAGDWKLNEVEYINNLLLLSAKPIVYLINMTEHDFIRKKNKWLKPIFDWVQTHGAGPIIPFCAQLESQFAALEGAELAAFEEEKKVKSQAAKIITTGYHSLDLIHFFTCGADEVRCWTIRKGTKAPDAAGVIHTDFQKGFICAEVMTYEDFAELKNENAVKAAGKYRQQGKTYDVQDGDIIFFKANTGGGLNKKKK